jgi:hypothetical protein
MTYYYPYPSDRPEKNIISLLKIMNGYTLGLLDMNIFKVSSGHKDEERKQRYIKT